VAFEVPREGSKSTLADSTVAIGGVRSDKAIPPRLSCRQDQYLTLLNQESGKNMFIKFSSTSF